MLNFSHSYQDLPKSFYTHVDAAVAGNPQLVVFNQSLAKALALDLEPIAKPTLAKWFCGQDLPPTASPIAQAYAGHQFGHLNMLGDGRALLLGELQTPRGLVDMQLKGSGKTPFSRGGDGKATLAPMLREYLISEAMHALGVPSTRSLAVVSTGETVRRRGNREGAIVVRLAASHLRVGTFVYADLLSQQQQSLTPLTTLLDYACQRHYPQLSADHHTHEALAWALLECLIARQIELVVHWQRIGFVHGVMNTDNITISGETIDYGPCAFMEYYDRSTTFSSIDHTGRYAFGQQAAIMQWNMARFAESLLPLLGNDSDTAVARANDCIINMGKQHETAHRQMMQRKLGLNVGSNTPSSSHNDKAIDDIIKELFNLLGDNHLDYTNTFVLLMQWLATHVANAEHHRATDTAPDAKTFYSQSNVVLNNENPHVDSAFWAWCEHWLQHVQRGDSQASLSVMQANNPVIIPRNQAVENALAAAEDGDMTEFSSLLSAVCTPNDPTLSATRLSLYQRPASGDWQTDYQTFCGT